MVTIAELSALEDWMRERGVARLRAGDVELVLGPQPPRPAAKSEPITVEQEALMRREARRRQYELELGRKVTDAELEKLP